MATPDRIRELRDEALGILVADNSDAPWASSVLPDSSPLAWHIGHMLFIETYWLHERRFGNDQLTAAHANLYFPERIPKTDRAIRLPKRSNLLSWCRNLAQQNDEAWERYSNEARGLNGYAADYLPAFIAQHYAQHLELVDRIASAHHFQASAATDERAGLVRIQPAAVDATWLPIEAAEYDIGTTGHCAAYDNELPTHRRRLGRFEISQRPISSGEWATFIDDGGYQDDRWWDDEGSAWRKASNISAPFGWIRIDGQYFHRQVALELADRDDAPVEGISHYEAAAYARWAAARLPDEFEWEIAARLGLLEHSGRVWEWCSNRFAPYPGFTAFPYDRYSQPWFDDQHYVLRGSSRLTRRDIIRPGFRNFYTREQRHIGAGLRLAR